MKPRHRAALPTVQGIRLSTCAVVVGTTEWVLCMAVATVLIVSRFVRPPNDPMCTI